MANEAMDNYPNRRGLNSLFDSFLGDVADLAIDRRTIAGKQANQIYQNDSDQYYNPTSYAKSQTASEDAITAANGTSPAFVEWDVPTSSTNYERPRTVAAGYDADRQTMTVVFRDGTFYNYYEVTPSEWIAFHSSFSKGNPWLNRKNSKQSYDGLFINKPRGDAGDLSNVNPEIRAALYRVARTQQFTKPPRPGRKHNTLYKTGRGEKTYWGTTKTRSKISPISVRQNKVGY